LFRARKLLAQIGARSQYGTLFDLSNFKINMHDV
jgi:hypothetical protein